MKEENANIIGTKEQTSVNHIETPGHGPQGVDKAPGEETSEDNEQFSQETQKGKQVDADPASEEGKPINQSI